MKVIQHPIRFHRLTRREAMLVSHARRAAVAKYKAETTVKIKFAGIPLVIAPLDLLENINLLAGDAPYYISLEWRPRNA